MKNLHLTLLALLVSVSSTFAAQIELPTMLDKLIGGDDFVVVGDLKFDNFTYPSDDVVQGDMPSASQIAVQATPNADGLRLTGPFLDLPGGEGNGASDATVGFDVSVTTGAQILSATLEGNPSLKGGASGVAEVVETFTGVDDSKLVIFDKTATLSLVDTAVLSTPMSQLSVLKDILLLSQSDTNAATISVIDQTFVLTPEPSAVGLLMSGLLAVGLLRRRR